MANYAEVNLIQAQLELKKYAGEVPGTKMIKLETQEQVRKYLTAEFEEDVVKSCHAAASPLAMHGRCRRRGGLSGMPRRIGSGCRFGMARGPTRASRTAPLHLRRAIWRRRATR